MGIFQLKLNHELEDEVEKLDLLVGKRERRMAEQNNRMILGLNDYGVTIAVLDLLWGFIAENEKHSYVLLKSLLTGVEEKSYDHAKRYHLGIMESSDLHRAG